MHKFYKWFTAVSILIASAVTVNAQSVAPTKGVVRVKLQTEVAAKVGQVQRKAEKGRSLTGVTRLDAATREIKAYSIRPMLPPNPKFAKQRAEYGLDRWYVIDFDENVSVDQARKILASTPGVELSEEIVPMQLKEGNGFARRLASASPKASSGVSYMFNDPRLPDQWHYQNYGNLSTSVAGADINLFEAWKTETGSSKVVVAIIDGGVDYQHEDLAANMCVNVAELNGTPGVDDDNNGFVDDIYGYNFCTNSGDVYPHNHGTHVAGTVAAVSNNGIGVAGVAGGDGTEGSGVKMISCQVFDSRSGTSSGDFAAAIVYAAERGATIAQCSWGWSEPGYCEQAVLDAIDYFTETARSDNMTGGLCIFAAGNMGSTGDYYPACYDKVLAVTAMTNELMPASYSNFGAWADIIAPGGLLDYGESGGVLSTLPSNGYGYLEGTSMATPHVSGVAALILSKYGSPTFVSSSLRTQLETSVNDFYGFGNNEQYRGLYGSGYLDAAKALQMGDGAAPEPVADYTMAAAQDYISLTWTIPASSDNNVHHHIIYYSESPFTAADNLSALSTSVADTKFCSSGDSFTHEITGLKSLTTYYVAIAAVNRWGNASALSEVKTISTNAGPKMTLDVSSLNMNSTATAPEAKATFNIGNDDEGILKWEAYKRTVSITTSSVSRPIVGNVKPYSGKIAGLVVKSSASATVTPEYLAEDYPKDIKYYSQLWAYIGDEDRSLPNSMAQWFKVDADAYPDGFNLTHINVDGDGQRSLGTEPVVQIYKGDAAISSATCIAEVTPSYFAYNFPVALPEQIHFAPGESFWVVVHFEGNLEVYPLSMGLATSETVSQYSYMSNDKGKTWTQLAQALKGSIYESQATQMAWTITARSNNPDWSEMLVLNPASGTVLKGETQAVEVTADGTKMVNGTYKLKLHLTSNEGDGNTEHLLPITYKVAGNLPEIVVPKIVNFGSLLVGESKTIEVEVFNRGYGRFAGSSLSPGLYSKKNITSSLPHFSGPEMIQTGFPARTKVKFNLTYTPTEAGTHTGTITFTDYQGNKANIVVQGVATEPAKLVINPSTVDCGTLTVGEADVQKSFTISNAGKYPLEFVFPKFSQESIEGQSAKLHQFGYTVSSTLKGYSSFAYDGNPELIGATNIASQFTDNNVVSSAINLGFAFPYYGKTYEKAYITSFGGIMFAPNELAFRSPLSPTSESIKGTGLISAYGQQVWMGPQSRVEYAKVDGKFVVKFINVLATVYGDDTTPISFHITLSSNGDIEIHYDNYMAGSVFQEGVGLFCGINDLAVADAVTVTSADQGDYWGSEEPTDENQRFREFATGTAVKFEAPKASFVRSLNIPYAIVNPGEAVEVVATVGADATLNAGATFNNLAIVTNDPNPEHSFVRLEAVIDGAELKPEAALEKESIDLGSVFRTSVQKVPVTVKNVGHRTLTVSNVAVSDAAKLKFDNSAFEAVDIEPGMSKDFIITVSTANEGVVEGVVTVTTAEGDLTCSIKAEVIGCPEIAITPDNITATVESGTPLSQSVSIENAGNETLRYSIAPNPLVSLTLPEKDDAVTGYAYSFSGDDSSVKYKWEDIETNGLGEQRTLSYYMLHDYVAVDLPFEFPFYGKKYTKMYVYNTGFVSFTERHDDALWPEPPAEFPQGTVYTNIIAPYWGLHSMDQTKTAGTFHYVTDDRAVISFMEYGNSMNVGVCYQLILEKDGSFRFQYKGAFADAIIFAPFGLAGISNVDGSQGILLPERMLKFDSAVEFTPVVELPLAAGETDNITIDVDTKRMAGSYNADLKVTTNVPGSENIVFPVNVEITGTAAPQWPEDIVVEHVIGYQSTDYSDPLVQMGAMYNALVTVTNAGTAPFTIDYVQMTAPQVYDDWFEEYVDVFMLYANIEQEDWYTGEMVKGWTQYNGAPMTVGDEPAEFAVPMLPCDFANTPGEYDIKLTFMCNQERDDAFTKDVHVKYIVTPAPYLELDKDQIYVRATNETDKFTESVNLSNEHGDYKLTYSLSLDPTGVGEQTDGGIGGIDPWSTIKANNSKVKADAAACELCKSAIVMPSESGNLFDVPNDFEYRNALYYPASTFQQVSYSYGTGNNYDVFKEAVMFTAPAEGFNISHLYLAVKQGSASDYRVDIDIVSGHTPGEGDVLGHGKFILETPSTQGRFVVAKLDNPVFLNPGEEFHVQVTYAAGSPYPAFICPKEEAVVPGRYMGWVESYGWFDVAEIFKDQYGSLGYMLTCLETTQGEPWVKLLTPATDAVVEAGASTEVKVEINAISARLEKNNKAMLVIKSNDPQQPVVNFPIVLDKNGKPVIAEPEGIVYAKEGEETNVAITITEPDNDDLTIAFNDPRGNAVVASIEAGNGTVEGENGVYTVKGVEGNVTVNVAIKAEYGSASEGNVFDITATDAHGLYSEAFVRYNIEHVNRAPVALEVAPAEVPIEGTSSIYNFADFFTDPDGDAMTFAFGIAENDIVEAYPSASGVIFYGKKKGVVTATITATDAQGATGTLTLTIEVKDMSGIADVVNGSDSFNVTPNPVDGDINVYTDFAASDVVFALYDAAGRTIFNVSADCAPGRATVLPGESLAQGVYILTITTTDGVTRTTRIVKK